MYIISNFKDVYDGVAHTKGIDKTIVYERYSEVIKLNNTELKYFNLDTTHYTGFAHYTTRKVNLNFIPFIIGFCGKIYIVGSKEVINELNEKSIHYIYDWDEILSMYKKDSWYYKESIAYLTELKNSTRLQDIFYKYKTPIFIINIKHHYDDKIIINPCLKNYDFHKFMDVFTIFQEIEMYISGVIGVNTKPIVEISDKHKIIGHGFDFKYSFRKDKQS